MGPKLRLGFPALPPGRVRVGTVVAHEVPPRVRDLHQNPGHKLHRLDLLVLARLGRVIFAGVDDLGRAGGEPQTLQAHRGAHHVPHQRLDLPPVPRVREDPVMHGEAAPPPRQQKLDPLLAQQPSSTKQSQHLVAEQLLRRPLIHIRHRDPLPGARPASPRDQRVHPGVEVCSVSEGLDYRHYTRSKALILKGRRHELLHCLVRRPRQIPQ